MMKRKEVEDVFGGKDDFGGDTMASKSFRVDR